MSFKNIVQKNLSNVFVSVLLNHGECLMRCKIYKGGRIVQSWNKTFQNNSTEDIDIYAKKYLLNLQDEYNFVYISFLLNSMGQGAIDGCEAGDFLNHSVDLQSVSHISVDKKWSCYASFIEIKWAKNLFEGTGLDFLYSPFVVLNEFIAGQKPRSSPVLYLLNCQDFFILSVYKQGHLLFGAFFKTQSDDIFISSEPEEVEHWNTEKAQDNVESLISLDEQNVSNSHMEELTSLDDLSDIGDLSSEDSFSDVENTRVLGKFGQDFDKDISETDSDVELYGRDILVYKFLRSSMDEFYKNPLYRSEFIEEIVVFDNYEITSDIISTIESELLMDVEIHKVDIADKMCDMAIKEVFG